MQGPCKLSRSTLLLVDTCFFFSLGCVVFLLTYPSVLLMLADDSMFLEGSKLKRRAAGSSEFCVMSSSITPLVSRERPPLLPVSKTCVYKTVERISIPVDLYFPSLNSGDACPVMLFVHGGGWIGGNRTDYSRPMLQEFLDLGFVVLSMDYRLLPESSFDSQLEDVRDIESWIQERLAVEVYAHGLRCDTGSIIVVGGSAGAHLALLVVRPALCSCSNHS